MIDDLRARAPRARIVVVGYGIYVRSGGCFPAQPINPADATFFQAKVDELDDRLQQVAARHHAEFFDTRLLSLGHDICAAPRDRYVEGFVLTHPAAPLHPNAMGATAVATVLAAHLRASGA